MQRVYDTAAPMVSQFPYFARLFFFFNDTATTEIYTLSLHDALPISFTGSGAIGRRLLEYSARSNLKRSEEHTSELQSPQNLVCRLLLEKKTRNKVLVDKEELPSGWTCHAAGLVTQFIFFFK